ncbi:Nn.00g000570.m01.CDS01 [Neocucurbitaria sp. VM-36]
MLRSIIWLGYATATFAQFDFTHSQYETSPPVYPSPNITGAGGWEEALGRARAFVAKLTLEEKAGMVTGTPGPCVGNIPPIQRLNFSGLCLHDGPLAIRQAVYASVFSAELSAAASWDRSLVRQRGQYMGNEFKGKGAHIALGPVVGPLGRSPFGGRNWEGFSPDAYLSGELVAETVQGIQSAGVQATTKHYILNEQETQRNPSTNVNGTTIEALSSNVDDKARTLYVGHKNLYADFKLLDDARNVHAGTASVMCSYNRINGSYGCANSKTLNGLLKEELGFQGYVMSDWLAVHSGVASINAGLDMNMPGGIDFLTGSPSYFGENITTAVNNGTLPVERVDDMVLRILTPYFFLNQDVDFPPVDGYTPNIGFYPQANFVYNFTLGPIVDVREEEHAKLIRDLGAAGTVLLKNINASLPLKRPKNIGVFGNDAADFTQGQYSLSLSSGIANGDYDIGTLAVGGGSGTGRFTYVVPPLDAIKSRAQSYGALVQYITNNAAIVDGGLSSLAPLPLDVCIVFLKSWASEGADRTTLIAEWNSTLVVETTAALCPNTIVVLHGASPNVLPWANNPNVTAILAAHMPGQESGNSIADILWGDINPSGRLPYTIANNETDYTKNIVNSTELLMTTDPNAWQADFVEGNLIDYKGFDAKNASVAYEFGFGLSYTTFTISNLEINIAVANASRTPDPQAQVLPGGNAELWATLATVSVSVTNTGDVAGSTVPQLYLSYPDEAQLPVRSLRGFEKIALGAGASGVVQFPLMRRDLSYWDTSAQTWRLPSGDITASRRKNPTLLPSVDGPAPPKTVKHGLVADNLLECTVVLADGRIVKSSATENEDLFWALRGAGQNFGVATEFVFRTHQQGDLWAGFMMFPPTPENISKAVEICNFIFTPDAGGYTKATGKAAAGIGFVRPPPAGGQVLFFVAVVFNGPEDDGKELFKDVIALEPAISTMAMVGYEKANKLLQLPIGARASLKGSSFELPIRPEFVVSILEAYTKFTDEVPDAAGGQIIWELLDPTKIIEVPNTSMAFANRGRHFNTAISPLWWDEANDEVCRQWSRDVALLFKAELERDGAETGGSGDGWIGKRGEHGATMVYGNYDQYEERSKDVFGANYERLQELKAKYDPANMFNKLFAIIPKA